jgi:hypothetical protein
MLLHPTDPERSRVFYRDTLGLAIYREFGSGPDRGTVFFLGGFLELSARAAAPPAPGVALWLQVRELAGVRRELGERGVRILREPRREPWGLLEMWLPTQMGCGSALWSAGGASAAPPRLTRTSVSSIACRSGLPRSRTVPSGLPKAITRGPAAAGQASHAGDWRQIRPMEQGTTGGARRRLGVPLRRRTSTVLGAARRQPVMASGTVKWFDPNRVTASSDRQARMCSSTSAWCRPAGCRPRRKVRPSC